MSKAFIYKVLFIIIYFIIILSTERAYYQSLFNESLELIPKFQKSNPNSYYFWKFIAYLGGKPVLGSIYLILFLFLPLNKVFIMTFLLIFTGYIDHISKILYRQERPLWMNDEIDVHSEHACGYGNPSGHALSSSCLYLSLWYMISDILSNHIKDNKKLYNITKYGILGFCLGIIYLIMTSRIYLGVHSINQIIFGFLIGVGIFLLFLPLFKTYYSTATEFLNNHYNYRYFTLGLISTGILIYYISYFCREDIENVDTLLNWRKMCLDQKWSKILIKGSFMGSESIFIILGFYIGLYYVKCKIDKNYQNKEEIIFNWNKEKFIFRLLRLIILCVGFIPVGIIFLLNLFDISYILFYILTPFLFFLGGFLTFGPCLLFGFKIISAKIYNYNMIHLEVESNEE